MSRRTVLKRVAGAGAGVAGLSLVSTAPAAAQEKWTAAIWLPGGAAGVSIPLGLRALSSNGSVLSAYQNGGSNEFWFAVPTPLILSNSRLSLALLQIRFATREVGTRVTRVKISAGLSTFLESNNLSLTSSGAPNSLASFSFNSPVPVDEGISVQIGVDFASGGFSPFEVHGAGLFFV